MRTHMHGVGKKIHRMHLTLTFFFLLETCLQSCPLSVLNVTFQRDGCCQEKFIFKLNHSMLVQRSASFEFPNWREFRIEKAR